MENKSILAFIQNPIGSKNNYQYDEQTFQFLGTDEIFGKYPFPYGFIPNTKAEDGDCLDCFVITNRSLETGKQYELTIIGLMEMWENKEEDHKLLLEFPDENIEFTDILKSNLKTFESQIFSNVDNREMKVGRFLKAEQAIKHWQKSIID